MRKASTCRDCEHLVTGAEEFTPSLLPWIERLATSKLATSKLATSKLATSRLATGTVCSLGRGAVDVRERLP